MSEFENKVLEMLKKIDEKLDKVLMAKPPTESAKKSEEVAPVKKEEAVKPVTVRPSAVVEKQVEEEKVKEKPPVEGRRVCKCGSTEFNTVEDKTKVLFQQGGMKVYAKKLICRRCGEEHT